jgi:hypothetical protein
MANVAASNNKDAVPGTNIMVAGLAFRVFSLLIFTVLTLEFTWRARKWNAGQGSSAGDCTADRLQLVSNWTLGIFASLFSLAIVCIFTYCFYRVFEMSDGWTGHLIEDELMFIVLEGV